MNRIPVRQALGTMFRDLFVLNRHVLMVSLSITILSIIVFILNGFYPVVNQLLASSTNTPWGVVTSIVVHGNVPHIVFNLFILWIMTAYLMFQSDFLKHDIMSREEITKRLKFSMIVSIAVVMGLNILYSFILRPDSTTMGSSGVVFTFFGVSMAFSFMNVSHILKKFRIRGVPKMVIITNLYSIVANTLVFIALYFAVTSDTKAFFVIGDPQVNSLIHLLSFTFTFFMILIYEYVVFHLPTMIQKFKKSNP